MTTQKTDSQQGPGGKFAGRKPAAERSGAPREEYGDGNDNATRAYNEGLEHARSEHSEVDNA